MTYRALATDFDGTLAFEGRVEAATLAALERARAAGHRLIMVTGRELHDLFNTFEHSHLFDRIVAENGAVLYDPANESIDSIAPGAPPALVARLEEQKVPLSVGHSIVATVEPYEHQVLAAIRDLGLEWHVIFNKGSVMALPAENDHAFMRMCGLAVAVANALPSVKENAHLVTRGARGDGVTELIEQWLASTLPHPAAVRPR
jgi:hydroxymethylpyrimidine pyrophosphatase-like HAD family hydrolase